MSSQNAAYLSALENSAEAMLHALKAVDADREAVTHHISHPFSNMSRADWSRSIDLWLEHGRPLLESQAKRDCPACRSRSHRYLFHSFDGYPYHECNQCGTWFVPHIVDHDLFEAYFQRVPEARKYGDYTNSQITEPDAIQADAKRFDEYYRELKSAFPGKPLATLDIGCGVGNSLIAAGRNGFKGTGAEVNANAISIAQGLHRDVGHPNDVGKGQQFDVVTMWETLEHMHDASGGLAYAKDRMSSDGILALTVPNLNAPELRFMRGDNLHIHGGPAWPGHINLFTLESLSELLKNQGFKIVWAEGQFSSSLIDLIGYGLGRWQGAHTYRSPDVPARFDISKDIIQLAASHSSVWAFLEEAMCLAPILKVYAVHAEAESNPVLENWMLKKRSHQAERLNQMAPNHDEIAFDIEAEAVSFDDYTYKSDEACLSSGSLRISANEIGSADYIWVGETRNLVAGSRIVMRGFLRQGGLSLGLLLNDSWVDTALIDQPGPFGIEIAVSETMEATPVISNACPEGSQASMAIVDRLEISRTEL